MFTFAGQSFNVSSFVLSRLVLSSRHSDGFSLGFCAGKPLGQKPAKRLSKDIARSFKIAAYQNH